MPGKLKVVVSIVNYRTAELTLGCVRSVLADLADERACVVVVDNLSGDGSAEIIERWIDSQNVGERVSLIRSQTNSGFAGGHNQGMSIHNADYYAILNSDSIVRPGFFRAILRAGRDRAHAGILAPRIEHLNGESQVSCFRFPSPFSELIRAAETGPITKLLSRFVVPLDSTRSDPEIEWASFACVVLRGTMVEQIGQMDQGYFLYFEDTEYCLRARRLGWQIAHIPEAVAVHFRGGSGPVKALQLSRDRLPRYYYASRSRFFVQAYGRIGLVVANLLWIFGRLIAIVRIALGLPFPRAHRNEFFDIWTDAFSRIETHKRS